MSSADERTHGADGMDVDEEHCPSKQGAARVGEAQSESVQLRWKTGSELPPFVSTNAAAMQLLGGLLAGTVDNTPSIGVSEAVALQTYWLVFDGTSPLVAASAAASSFDQLYVLLASLVTRTLYVLLASLVTRTRVAEVDAKAVKRLRDHFNRKKSNHHATPGLVGRFKSRVDNRKQPGSGLPDDIEEARTHTRWQDHCNDLDGHEIATRRLAAGAHPRRPESARGGSLAPR
jgi:hypothetical protein